MPNLSNGVSSNAGFGFFVEMSGADSYDSTNVAEPGRYGQNVVDGDFENFIGRDDAGSVALFLDLGGVDRYQGTPPEVRDGASWRLAGAASPKLPNPVVPPAQVSFGADLDG